MIKLVIALSDRNWVSVCDAPSIHDDRADASSLLGTLASIASVMSLAFAAYFSCDLCQTRSPAVARVGLTVLVVTDLEGHPRLKIIQG